ncbi:hypothetical protein JCM6882_000150 [Rhodosporidiobolus microsporus]
MDDTPAPSVIEDALAAPAAPEELPPAGADTTQETRLAPADEPVEGDKQVEGAAEDDHDASAPAGDAPDAPPPAKKPRTSLLPSSTSSSSLAARSRTTRAGPAVVSPSEGGDGDAQDTEEDETRGKDGKQYLLSGIYWSTGLPASSSVRWTSPGKDCPTDWRDIDPEAADELLLPKPKYHGETLVEDEKPFELPFDVLRDFWYGGGAGAGAKGKERDGGEGEAEAKREGKGGDRTTQEDIAKRELSKKPEPYKYIKTNMYVDRKPDRAHVPAICMCTPPARSNENGCGADCINRLMQYCCDPKLCPCGDRCSNVPLNRREGIPEGKDGLRVIWTGNRGFGLKTMVPIKKGEFVIEYRGEIITRDESYRRVLFDYKDRPSYYFLDYDGFEVLDAGQRGNASRFINHSCGPNLHVVRWRLATMEEYQMGIFALHDIPAGTELTYDYGWQDFSSIAPNPKLVVAAAAAAAAAAAVEPDPEAQDEAATAPLDEPVEEVAPTPAASTSASTSASALLDASTTSFSSASSSAPTVDTAPSTTASASTSAATSLAVCPPSPALSSTSTLSSLSPSPPASPRSPKILLGPGPAASSTSAVLASIDTAIDPARQRCYCGAAECSGFLGGRKKGGSHKRGAAGAAASAEGGKAVGGPKGKGVARHAGELEPQVKHAFAPPKTPSSSASGSLTLAQARVQVSHSTSSSVAAGVSQRGTAGGAVAARLKKGKGKVVERLGVEKVVGAMRSGREAAKKALGKLMGSGSSAAPVPEEEEEQ